MSVRAQCHGPNCTAKSRRSNKTVRHCPSGYICTRRLHYTACPRDYVRASSGRCRKLRKDEYYTVYRYPWKYFSKAELDHMNYSVQELMDRSATAEDLLQLGYSALEINGIEANKQESILPADEPIIPEYLHERVTAASTIVEPLQTVSMEQPVHHVEPQSEVEPEPRSEVEPEPQSEVEPEPQSEVEPEPQSEMESEPQSELRVESEPQSENLVDSDDYSILERHTYNPSVTADTNTPTEVAADPNTPTEVAADPNTPTEVAFDANKQPEVAADTNTPTEVISDTNTPTEVAFDANKQPEVAFDALGNDDASINKRLSDFQTESDNFYNEIDRESELEPESIPVNGTSPNK